MEEDILALQKGIDDVLDIVREEKPKDYFVERGYIPLGTKRPYDFYEEGKIPEEDIVKLNIDKTNVLNMLTVAPTGVGKSRFVKRIVGYMQKFGYNILNFDPKSYEYLIGGIKKGNGKRIHQYEENTKYKVKAFCPCFVKRHIFENKNISNKFNFYSHAIKDFKDATLWRNLGISDKASNYTVAEILKGCNDLNEISFKIMRNRDLMANTKRASVGSIAIMQDLGFFDNKYKPLNIKKEWERGNMIAVSYFGQQGSLMNTDIAKIIQMIREIGNKELQSESYITPKFINFDDSLYYAKRDRQDDFNLALREIKNAQNNYRSLGINTNIVVQNPSFIEDDVIDGCTTKFVWGIENPESLRGLIPQGAFELVQDRRLEEDESRYTYQCIFIKGRRRWEAFYPFDVPYGHGV